MSLWQRFQSNFVRVDSTGLTLDISRMRYPDNFFEQMTPAAEKAFAAMKELEAGAIANPDEGRMVGHYWLRNSSLAPNDEVRRAVDDTNAKIKAFVADVHSGKIAPPGGGKFTQVLVVGIGGSALGPQFVADALGADADDKLTPHFLDNTDPAGFDRVLTRLKSKLGETLTIVISKSGGTKETRNGMLEVGAAYKAAGLDYSKHVVAVTGEGSELDKYAVANGWLERFPMFDWVGGRTSVMSAVGLLAMALQGIDIDAFLRGLATMDEHTRLASVKGNAAMLVALMWYYAGDGKGKKDMVVLPYKDRLVLFSKYLQQLVMESLGKELDRDGKVAHQGIAVYGNKGSTDQHAYVQQLRDGVHNFFVTFIEVRKARSGAGLEVEPGVQSGDYLQGFLRGTRSALYENNRDSITISLPEVNAFTVGALIALYERAVGFYGSLVNINAYHQPGVEAGKKAATRLLKLQADVAADLAKHPGVQSTADAIATRVNADPEDVYHVLVHMAANRPALKHQPAATPGQETFGV
ncbi:MAG: glucose-6-phosphate isomerase [Verrucomicrobia bacterium]|nr:glucose-6-phosphate isomerase [Verrucomicrobiota bacterium]